MNKKVLYLFIIFLLSIVGFSYLFIDPHFSYLQSIYSGFHILYRELVSIVFIAVLSIFFLFYLYFLKNASSLSLLQVKYLIGISLILVLAYPATLSFDIFNYTTTAKVLFLYRENPYVVMPIELLGEDFLNYTHAANKYALYGPSWLLLTGIPSLMSFNNIILSLFTTKILVAVFYVLTCWAIWILSKDKYQLLFFSLNPLVLIESLVSSHNDMVMMFFAINMFVFLKNKKFLLALLFLVISILIKYATILLLPVVIWVIWNVYTKRKIDWNKSFIFSGICMLIAFLFSPIREEMYPWYFIWILPFVVLVNKKHIYYLAIFFSFGLMLRYVPYMYSGTHVGNTPLIKNMVTFSIPFLGATLLYLRKFLSKKV